MSKRRRFTAEFKAKVALEALRGEMTLAEISKKYDVHPNMISAWKKQVAQEAAQLFARGAGKTLTCPRAIASKPPCLIF